MAVSVAGVMLVEYLALSRLVTAVTSWPLRRVIIALGVAAVAAAPFTAGLLLSAGVGLFGYQESLAVPYAGMSLVVEFAGAAVLVTAAAVVLVARPANRRSAEQSF